MNRKNYKTFLRKQVIVVVIISLIFLCLLSFFLFQIANYFLAQKEIKENTYLWNFYKENIKEYETTFLEKDTVSFDVFLDKNTSIKQYFDNRHNLSKEDFIFFVFKKDKGSFEKIHVLSIFSKDIVDRQEALIQDFLKKPYDDLYFVKPLKSVIWIFEEVQIDDETYLLFLGKHIPWFFRYITIQLVAILFIIIWIIFLCIYFYIEFRKYAEFEKSNFLKLIYEDSDTHLPNEKKLLEDLAKLPKGYLILIYFDEMQILYDFFGKSMGEKFSLWIINHLKSCIKGKVQLYSISINHFAFIAIDMEKEDVLDLEMQIHYIFSHYYYDLEELKIYMTISMGAAQIKNNAPDLLFLQASIAEKESFRRGEGIVFFERNLSDNTESGSGSSERIIEELQWSKILHFALEHNHVFAYYQPITNLKTGKIESFECLMRCQDKDGKIHLPGEFIDIAKKKHLYRDMIEQLIIKSLETFKNTNYKLSFNVAFSDLLDKKFIAFIKQIVEKYSFMGNRIIFELLETEEFRDFDILKDFIESVKKYGCLISIDDFGTGYSNVVNLITLVPDYVKLDGSLIKNLNTNDKSLRMVTFIGEFSNQLGIKTVAEFVHNEIILDIVKSLQIDYVQGFYLGKPQSIEELRPLIDK